MSSELREARKRVRQYVRDHEANPYQGPLVLGFVGMNGKPLLRLDDVRTLSGGTATGERA